MSGNCPEGSNNDSNAPWNEGSNESRQVSVLVSITLSKEVMVDVDDYDYEYYGKDEDGFPDYNYDYSNCNFKTAVENQIYLPQDDEKFKDWSVDDFEVMCNE